MTPNPSMASVEMNYHQKVDKMFTDLYLGRNDDNPPFTVRLALLEHTLGRIDKNLSKLVWLCLGTLTTAITALLIHITTKGRF